MTAVTDPDAPDLERRFGGLRRLVGDDAYHRVRGATVAVVGLGGVGSWSVEALARSGIGGLVLIDLDHVAESNINRQVQALSTTLGQSKPLALAERIAQIHPGCRVHAVEDFASADNWPRLLPGAVHAVIDACDDARAKVAMAAWARATGTPFIAVGAAGGKRRPQATQVDDLAAVTHDPLLARVRQQLRRDHDAPRAGPIGVRCVFSRERVHTTAGVDAPEAGLNCRGYGSSVAVTATFGFTAAAEVLGAVEGR